MVKLDSFSKTKGIHTRRLSLVFYAFGEALIQFFIIGGLIFIFERIGIFQVYVKYWDSSIVWWEAEVGVILILVLLVSLILTNILFIFIKWHWFYKGFLESICFTGTYFLIEFSFSGIVVFGYSNIYLYIAMLFFSVIFGNLIFNKFIPLK